MDTIETSAATNPPATPATRVSANYRDRSDKNNRWLFRPEGSLITEYQTCPQLVCTNVKFKTTRGRDSDYDHDGELGFGCQVVAVADSIAPSFEGVPEVAVRLKFNEKYGNFYTDNVPRVNSCNQLYLLPDGAMWAVL